METLEDLAPMITESEERKDMEHQAGLRPGQRGFTPVVIRFVGCRTTFSAVRTEGALAGDKLRWVSLGAASELLGEGAVKSLSDPVRQGRRLSVAVHFNCFPRGVHDESTILTMPEVSGELLGQNGI